MRKLLAIVMFVSSLALGQSKTDTLKIDVLKELKLIADYKTQLQKEWEKVDVIEKYLRAAKALQDSTQQKVKK